MSQSSPATAPAEAGSRSLQPFRNLWTAFIVVLTTVPYLVNWRGTPAGYHYTWILPPYPEDSLAYQAWARQAAHGSFLFQDKYTALPHAPFLFHPFFLVSGWISALTGCEIGVVFLVLKAVGVVLFFAAFYRYVDWLGLRPVESIATTLLLGISSGFGGLIMMSRLGARWPIPLADLALPDLNTFGSLVWNPLFPYSLTLLVLAVYCLDKGTREGRAADFWRAGLATGLLALLHPYSQPVVLTYAVMLAFVRRRKGSVGLMARYALSAAPFALYVALMAVFNPIVSRHDVQGAMQSPPLSSYVDGFGLPLLLVGAGLVLGGQTLLRRRWPVLLWFTLSVSFAYLPIWFQRKLVFGSHVPLCILAGVVFGFIVAAMPSRAAGKAVMIFGLVVCLPISATSSYYLLKSERAKVASNTDGAYYVPNEIMDALKFLKNQGKPDAIVCAGLETSRLIPAISGNTVLWGHWAMTVDNAERQQWFEQLFGAKADLNDPRRADEFWDTGIQYIFAEGGLKQDLEQNPLAWRPILEKARPVYTNNLVTIYERAGVSHH